MVEKIFFQSSLPRAGSTLLQNIMGQNPDFYVTPTSGVLELVFAARANYTDSPEFKAQDPKMMQLAFRAFCREGVFGFFNALTNKPYVIDKSRGWGYYQDFLEFFYPQAKVICMIRDPRAIFASMEKNYRKNPEKAQKLTIDKNMQGITSAQRVDAWASGQPVGLALERLKQIVHEGRDKKIHFIKFEELTANPEKTIQEIYKYLGVKEFKHDFNNVEQITKEDDAVYGVFGDHKIRKKVEALKIDYEDVLGKDVCESIKNHYAWFYEHFNYK